jgi:hypothetical protein
MKIPISSSEINSIQGVSEISALILTGNRTHQKEQLFSLPFWRKTLRNGLKNRKDFPKTVHISKPSYCNGLKRPFLAKKSQSRDFCVEGSFALRAEKNYAGD